MKQKIIICLLILSLLPLSVFAGDIEGYQLMYSKLNEEQLHYQRLNNTEEIVISTFAATGGLVLAGVGAVAGYIGYSMVTAEPIIDLDNEFAMFMFPLTLTALVLQYAGGVALIGMGGTILYVGSGISLAASGNIVFQFRKNREIHLELKKFRSVSQEYRPATGIGISIPLRRS